MVHSNNHREKRDEERSRYRPRNIKWLFVAEAPPAETDRYFYFEKVEGHDHLFLETMKALYCQQPYDIAHLRNNKKYYLERFRNDGFHLIDAVVQPFRTGMPRSERKTEIEKNQLNLFGRLEDLVTKETSIILVKKSVFDTLNGPLNEKQYPVINQTAVPFPCCSHQKRYRELIRGLIHEEE